jgi:hypothetical protein
MPFVVPLSISIMKEDPREKKLNERTDRVADNSGAGDALGALNQHFAVAEELEKTGEFKKL